MTAPELRPGDRIEATIYGAVQHGTVSSVGRGVVWCRMDGASVDRFMFPQSLRLSRFAELKPAEVARVAGQEPQSYYRMLLHLAILRAGSQTALARRLARSQGSISRLATGRRPIRPALATWLIQHYG